jgi:hypothetical protein
MPINTTGLQFSSSLDYDQVIYATTDTFSLTENGSGTEIFSTINQYGLPLGIFSIDDGVTWNDIGSPYPLSLDVNKVSLFVECNQFGNIFLQLKNPAGGSTAYTVLVKIVLLATDNPSELPNSVVTTTNPTAYQFGTDANYRYIVKTNTQALAATTEYTFNHGQGAIPVIQNWAITGTGANQNYTLYGVSVDSRWNSSIAMEYYVICYDTNNMYFGLNDALNSPLLYTRVYQQ